VTEFHTEKEGDTNNAVPPSFRSGSNQSPVIVVIVTMVVVIMPVVPVFMPTCMIGVTAFVVMETPGGPKAHAAQHRKYHQVSLQSGCNRISHLFVLSSK
jgi:hypothetical protein